MIRRLSLSQRLTLVFTAVLLLCAVATCGVQLYNSHQYGNAMVQRLSAGLAQQIVKSEPLLSPQGKVNREKLKTLFDRLMTLNPSVELYLVSLQGGLLADAAPAGHIKRQQINIVPLQTVLNSTQRPVYGDDPRSIDGEKVFSVAPIRLNGELQGYLYIILQGEEMNALAETAWQQTFWNTVVWTLLLVVIFGVLTGLLLWYWVTRPVKTLTAEVGGLDQDSISTIKRLATLKPERHPANEVALLRNAFIELAQQVVQQWDQLADSDRQRREFVANISHDLRTPLTSLLGYLETLSVKAGSLTAEESKQYLNIALRQGNKVRHLSQQLFELARLEHGSIKPQRETFSMAELVQDVAQKYDLAIETRQLTINVELPCGLPLMFADLSMMERVLTNLLDNAIRHTPEGGNITLRTRVEGSNVVVEVQDNGPGIPSELRASLFDRPSVLQQYKTWESHGGLGLMIVRRILQLHGGDIRLLEGNSGACFQFSLPL
ncbi:HAMP domain-containing histidine kinase [Salmonella enterica]|nr:HAMP domain-containing histidine kinase [Salmonella enterica]